MTDDDLQRARTRRILIWFWSAAGALVVLGIIGAATMEPEEPDAAPQPATPTTTAPPATTTTTVPPTTTTTTVPPTTTTLAVKDVFEDCMDPWDGNFNALEALIRDVLNDPGSMETHGTYYFTWDDLDDGQVTVRLDDGARNTLGGMVRTSAWAEMRPDCTVAEVTDYGF